MITDVEQDQLGLDLSASSSLLFEGQHQAADADAEMADANRNADEMMGD